MPLRKVGDHYHIDLPSKNGRVRESARTTDRKQAQAYLERRAREIWEQDQLGKAPPVTWLQAVKKWADHKPRGLPDRYRVNALDIPEGVFLPLSPASIEAALNGCSPGSWNRCLTIISVIHKIAGLEPPKVAKKPVPEGRTRFLNKREWARLEKRLKTLSPLLWQCARFTLATGLRENNVLNLEWSQVDLKRRTAFLWPDQVKNRAPLGVSLNDDALAVLLERQGLNKTWVFAHPDSGKPLYKASNKAWYAATKKAKLKGLRWHDLRHTWASWHIQNGTRIEELQKLGGWRSLQMVMRYAHLSTEHLAEAAARVKPV
jgi:integrase